MQIKLPPKDGGSAQDLELAPALVPLLAVGLSDVPGGVVAVDNSGSVAYPVGRSIAIHSPDAGQVCVSEARREVRYITALAASPDVRWLAVAEAMTNNMPPQVTLLDLRGGLERGTSLTGPAGADDYTCVSFSADGQLIIASSPLNNQPSTVFHVWDWATSSDTVASGTAPGFASKVSVNPRFTSNVFVQCTSAAFYMRPTSAGQYRPFQLEGLTKKAEVQFTDHTWLPDGRMALVLSDRRLVLVDGVQVTQTVALSGTPSCVTALPDGHVLVALQKGAMDLLKPESANPGSGLARAVTVKAPTADDAGATGIDLTARALSPVPGGSKVAVYIRGGPVLMLNVRLAKAKAGVSDTSGEQVWDAALPPMHSGTVVSVSVSMRRDYVVTASEDLTVRVWCWRPLRLVAVHQCHHTPLAVAIDPLGSELAVTYVDCVRLYSVVEGMLLEVGGLQMPGEHGKPPEELARCTKAAWSPTGHLLALASSQAGHEVLIFSPLHRSLLARLRGHYSAVLDLCWSQDGLYLASTSEGAVYTWHMEDFTRREENTAKGCFNSAVACTPDFGTLVVGDASQGIRVLETVRAAAPGPAAAPGVAGKAGGKGGSNGRDAKGVSGAGGAHHTPASGHHAGGHGDRHGPVGGDLEAISLAVTGTFPGTVLPVRAALAVAVTLSYKCLIGGGLRGAIRVCCLPPSSALHYQEYVPHIADLSCLVAHHEGRLVISADVHGMWMLHGVVAPQAYQAAAVQHLTLSPRRVRPHHSHVAHQKSLGGGSGDLEGKGGATGRGVGMMPLPPYGLLVGFARNAMGEQLRVKQSEAAGEVLLVRGTEMNLLKENVRELRDKLTKAATSTEYKVYEREQQVRRTVESELTRLRSEVQTLTSQLKKALNAVAETKAAAEAEADLAQKAMQEALAAERERFESMIAVEIERTNAAENEVSRIKTKFGRKLTQMQDQHNDKERAAGEKTAILQMHVGSVQQQAVNALEKAHAKMECEVKMDAEINDLEINRIEVQARQAVEERDEKFMLLFAKHTMQGGITNQALANAEELQKANDALRKDNTRLADQVTALTEELTAMHAAWAERDIKQRMADVEVRELNHQVAQGRLYTQLATNRIAELSSEIEPLKQGRADTQQQLAKLEAVQLRQAERRAKATAEFETVQAALHHARQELATVKAAANQQAVYWSNFTTQLFRTLHTVPVDKWAGIMGRLHADFVAGKDKLDWRKYQEADGAGAANTEAAKKEEEMTEQELRVQLRDVQAQMMHAQRMLEVSHTTRDKDLAGHRSAVGRLQAENVDMLAQLNVTKRELKEAHATIERLKTDVFLLRQQAQKQGGPGSAALSAASSQQDAAAALHHPSSPTHHSVLAARQAAGAAGAALRPESRGNVTLGSASSSQAGAASRPESRGAVGAAAASPRPSAAMAGAMTLAGIPEGGALVGSGGGAAPAAGGSSPPRARGASRGTGGVAAPPAPPGAAPDTVTGEMPSGGWWLGANSLFEVPSSLNVLRHVGPQQQQDGQHVSSSWTGPGSYRLRPATTSSSVDLASGGANAARLGTAGSSASGGVLPPSRGGLREGPGGGAGNFFAHTGRDVTGHQHAQALHHTGSMPATRPSGFTPATPAAVPGGGGGGGNAARLVFSPPTTAFSAFPPPPGSPDQDLMQGPDEALVPDPFPGPASPRNRPSLPSRSTSLNAQQAQQQQQQSLQRSGSSSISTTTTTTPRQTGPHTLPPPHPLPRSTSTSSTSARQPQANVPALPLPPPQGGAPRSAGSTARGSASGDPPALTSTALAGGGSSSSAGGPARSFSQGSYQPLEDGVGESSTRPGSAASPAGAEDLVPAGSQQQHASPAAPSQVARLAPAEGDEAAGDGGEAGASQAGGRSRQGSASSQAQRERPASGRASASVASAGAAAAAGELQGPAEVEVSVMEVQPGGGGGVEQQGEEGADGGNESPSPEAAEDAAAADGAQRQGQHEGEGAVEGRPKEGVTLNPGPAPLKPPVDSPRPSTSAASGGGVQPPRSANWDGYADFIHSPPTMPQTPAAPALAHAGSLASTLSPPQTAPAGATRASMLSRSSSNTLAASSTGSPKAFARLSTPQQHSRRGAAPAAPPPNVQLAPDALQLQDQGGPTAPEGPDPPRGSTPLTGQAAAQAHAQLAARSVSLAPGFLATLSGSVPRPAPTKLTTLGAGFRSFAPRGTTPPTSTAARR